MRRHPKYHDHTTGCCNGGDRSASGVWKRFKHNTTAHGIPHIDNGYRLWNKIMWTIFALACLACFCYNAYMLSARYFSYAITVSQTMTFESSLTFPAVTVCNNNPVRKSMLNNNPKLKKIINGTTTTYTDSTTRIQTSRVTSLSPTSTQPTQSTSTSSTSQCPNSDQDGYGKNPPPGQPPGFRTSDDTPSGRPQRKDFQLKLEVQQQLSQMTEAERQNIGYQLSDLIVDCDFAGYPCYTSTNFTQFYSSLYGNCYTFNSGWNKTVTLQNSTRPGPRYGLSLTFNLDQDEYIGELAESAGMRVVVHDQKRMPFPEDEGVAVSPGQLTYIGATMTKITRLGGVYGDCVNPNISNTNRNIYELLYPIGYSQSGCYNTCLQRNVLTICQCADALFPNTYVSTPGTKYPACDIRDLVQTACYEQVLELHKNNRLDCSCQLPCTETRYDTRISLDLWPSTDYSKTLWDTLAASNSKIMSILNQACDPTKSLKNLGKMVIYLENFAYTTIEESPDYDLWTFLADIGGIIGLYAGFSLFTIVEFIELIIELIMSGACRLCGGGGISTPNENHIRHVNVAERNGQPSVRQLGLVKEATQRYDMYGYIN